MSRFTLQRGGYNSFPTQDWSYLRADWAEQQQLEGADLAARYLAETPEELERTMHGKRTWLEEVKTLWCWINR